MLCGGSRRLKKKDATTPGSFRRAETSQSKVREITSKIFTPVEELHHDDHDGDHDHDHDHDGEHKGGVALSGGGREKKDHHHANSLPRSILWTMGLSNLPLTKQTLHSLVETRRLSREKYLKTISELRNPPPLPAAAREDDEHAHTGGSRSSSRPHTANNNGKSKPTASTVPKDEQQQEQQEERGGGGDEQPQEEEDKQQQQKKKKKSSSSLSSSSSSPFVESKGKAEAVLLAKEEYDRDCALRRMIEKDVERTYQDMEYFKKKSTMRMLFNILLVWAKTCGALGYRQGMNELLAVCLMVTKEDAAQHKKKNNNKKNNTKTEASETGNTSREDAISIPDGLIDEDNIEPDSFALFRLLMQQMSPLYHSHPRDGIRQKQPNGTGNKHLSEGGIGSGSLKTPLDNRVYMIHHVMLRRLEPQLYFRLEKLNVLPQLYMLRWLRLLFAREASDIKQLLPLLDALLGNSKGFELLNYMCLALVAGLKDELTKKEFEPAEVLKTLLRRQSIANSRALVEAAEVLHKDKLISMPVAQMQVYNAPLQGNGSRIEVVQNKHGGRRNRRAGQGRGGGGGGRNGVGEDSAAGGGGGGGGPTVEVKRPPMEGYVVGVKSQTLYWCVLQGPRLLWYADPRRKVTVAQTWLDGCVITGLGDGILEIQAPSLPVDKDDMKKEEQDASASCVSAQTTDNQNTTIHQQQGDVPPVFASAVKEKDDHNTNHHHHYHTTISNSNSSNSSSMSKSNSDHTNDNINGTSSQTRMSVRLEVKDEEQYRQWLERLQEAAVYSIRGRSMWRQCFL